MDVVSSGLFKTERKAKDKLSSSALGKVSSSVQATVVLFHFAVVMRGEGVVRRWAMGEGRAVLFGTGGMLVLCYAHSALVFLV